MRSYIHVSNQHAGLLGEQIEEMDHIRREVVGILEFTSQTLLKKKEPDLEAVAARAAALEHVAHEFDRNQIARIEDNSSKTRLTILFYAFVWDGVKIAEQTRRMIVVFRDTLYPETHVDRPPPVGKGADA
jgi:hypothetical protein